jgi:hypothetical protein
MRKKTSSNTVSHISEFTFDPIGCRGGCGGKFGDGRLDIFEPGLGRGQLGVLGLQLQLVGAGLDHAQLGGQGAEADGAQVEHPVAVDGVDAEVEQHVGAVAAGAVAGVSVGTFDESEVAHHSSRDR